MFSIGSNAPEFMYHLLLKGDINKTSFAKYFTALFYRIKVVNF